MNIDKFKDQHIEILWHVHTLRELAHAGIAANAPQIAHTIQGMTSTIKLHLAAENRALHERVLLENRDFYPRIEAL